MSFKNLFAGGEHSRNLGHFASIVSVAQADGKIGPEEEVLLKRFATRLDVSDSEYEKILKNPGQYPVSPSNSAEHRLERLHDLIRIVFADNIVDDRERHLVEKYAIALGYSSEQAEKLISRSIEIYSGGLSFEDFRYLINRK